VPRAALIRPKSTAVVEVVSRILWDIGSISVQSLSESGSSFAELAHIFAHMI
jgi:hypothetical protein